MNKTTKIRIADKLNQAADLIRDKGWIKNSLSSEYGFCAIGAMNKVCPVLSEQSNANLLAKTKTAFQNYLKKKYGATSIINFNDYQTSGRKQVIRAFRTAAQLLLKS